MAVEPGSREQLMGLLSRKLPSVPSVLADAIMSSDWLKAREAAATDKAIQEVIDDI